MAVVIGDPTVEVSIAAFGVVVVVVNENPTQEASNTKLPALHFVPLGTDFIYDMLWAHAIQKSPHSSGHKMPVGGSVWLQAAEDAEDPSIDVTHLSNLPSSSCKPQRSL